MLAQGRAAAALAIRHTSTRAADRLPYGYRLHTGDAAETPRTQARHATRTAWLRARRSLDARLVHRAGAGIPARRGDRAVRQRRRVSVARKTRGHPAGSE